VGFTRGDARVEGLHGIRFPLNAYDSVMPSDRKIVSGKLA